METALKVIRMKKGSATNIIALPITASTPSW